jgi:5-formyltetrahydrofolate cyclo-ligase
MSVYEKKEALRAQAKERRRAAFAAAGPAAYDRLADNFYKAAESFTPWSASSAVSGYWSIADEMDVRPLLRRLYRDGHPVGLPVVVKKGEPLIFRHWWPGMTLAAAGFGLQHPPASEPEIVPDVLLVPLLAFDRRGYRVGWGGGFYDRTLARLRKAQDVIAVGVCYGAQETDEVPTTPDDQPLDWVVTDAGVIKIG